MRETRIKDNGFVVPARGVPTGMRVFDRVPIKHAKGERIVTCYGGNRLFVRDAVWSDGQVDYRVIDGLTEREADAIRALYAEA